MITTSHTFSCLEMNELCLATKDSKTSKKPPIIGRIGGEVQRKQDDETGMRRMHPYRLLLPLIGLFLAHTLFFYPDARQEMCVVTLNFVQAETTAAQGPDRRCALHT